MASRLPRFLVFFSLIALATTLYVVSGFSRTVTRSSHVPIETHAPSPGSDSALQSNIGAIVANDSRWEIRKQHQRSETFRLDGERLFPAGLNLRASRDCPRDHSPQHSIPLLI